MHEHSSNNPSEKKESEFSRVAARNGQHPATISPLRIISGRICSPNEDTSITPADLTEISAIPTELRRSTTMQEYHVARLARDPAYRLAVAEVDAELRPASPSVQQLRRSWSARLERKPRRVTFESTVLKLAGAYARRAIGLASATVTGAGDAPVIAR